MRAVAFIALCLAAPASGALVRVDLEARAPVAAEQARDGLALVAQCVAPDCLLEVKRLAPARVRASFRVADGAVDALATAITAAPQSLFRLALGSELVAPPAISLEHPRPSAHAAPPAVESGAGAASKVEPAPTARLRVGTPMATTLRLLPGRRDLARR